MLPGEHLVASKSSYPQKSGKGGGSSKGLVFRLHDREEVLLGVLFEADGDPKKCCTLCFGMKKWDGPTHQLDGLEQITL